MWAYFYIKYNLKGNLEDFRLLKVDNKILMNVIHHKTLKKYVLLIKKEYKFWHRSIQD